VHWRSSCFCTHRSSEHNACPTDRSDDHERRRHRPASQWFRPGLPIPIRQVHRRLGPPPAVQPINPLFLRLLWQRVLPRVHRQWCHLPYWPVIPALLLRMQPVTPPPLLPQAFLLLPRHVNTYITSVSGNSPQLYAGLGFARIRRVIFELLYYRIRKQVLGKLYNQPNTILTLVYKKKVKNIHGSSSIPRLVDFGMPPRCYLLA